MLFLPRAEQDLHAARGTRHGARSSRLLETSRPLHPFSGSTSPFFTVHSTLRHPHMLSPIRPLATQSCLLPPHHSDVSQVLSSTNQNFRFLSPPPVPPPSSLSCLGQQHPDPHSSSRQKPLDPWIPSPPDLTHRRVPFILPPTHVEPIHLPPGPCHSSIQAQATPP